MPTYLIPAFKPGNIIIDALTKNEAIDLAKEGEGEWEEDDAPVLIGIFLEQDISPNDIYECEPE